MTFPDRLLLALGALAGLLGVVASAGAAHVTGGGNLETAGRFLMIHAAVLVGVSALTGAGLVRPALGRLAGLAFVLGLALFCGDLSLRAFRGVALFRSAAPAGGVALMAGWGLLALAALVPRRGGGRR